MLSTHIMSELVQQVFFRHSLQVEETLWLVLQGNPYGQYLAISNILMLPSKGKLSGEKHTQLISLRVATRAESFFKRSEGFWSSN